MRLQNRSYLLGQTVQPLVVSIGEKVIPEEFQVIINSVKYSLPSMQEAFDVCFKSFYALNVAYPKQGERVWQIIQNCVYRIGLTDNFQQVEGVLTEIVNLSGVQAWEISIWNKTFYLVICFTFFSNTFTVFYITYSLFLKLDGRMTSSYYTQIVSFKKKYILWFCVPI